MKITDIPQIINDQDDITAKRIIIKQQIIKESKCIDKNNFDSAEDLDIQLTLQLYDKYFFDNTLKDLLEDRIVYRFSNRMSKSLVIIEYDSCKEAYILKLSFPLIAHSFDRGKKSIDVCGIPCHGSLDAMMCILENIIIHLIEYELDRKSSSSKVPFIVLANRIFGHTDTNQMLR